MQYHLFPTKSWFIIFLIITFVHAPSSAFANDDERYVSCSNSFDCGDIKGVGYPFWGSNRPDYCGYPELKLDCSDQDPEITIEKLTYKFLASITRHGLSVLLEKIMQKTSVRHSFSTPLGYPIY
jgi:hypothetical protein